MTNYLKSVGLALCLAPGVLLAEPTPAAADPMRLFEDGNVFELRVALKSLPGDAPNRPLFEGMVAAALRQRAAADAALNVFLEKRSADRSLSAQAVSILAGMSLREGRYSEADKYLARALSEFGDAFDEEEIKGLRQSRGVAVVLKDAPAQTTVLVKPGELKRTRDKVGLTNVEMRIQGAKKSAVFDTGANFCVASESFAQDVGLEMLPGDVEVASSTGLTVPAHLGLAHELVLAGCTFQHVAFLVFRDADLSFPQVDYTIQAIIGFPVIAELGRVRVYAGSRMEIGLPSEPAESPTLALKDLEAMVAVRQGARIIPFFLDTGASHTAVTEAFKEAFPEVMARATTATVDSGGAGGVVTATLAQIPRLELGIGDETVVLQKVHVKPDSADAGRDYFGVIGTDLLFSHGGYEFDLRAMTFRLLPASATP